jgi:TolB-like protein/DNA-binding winged helix-turn-helix (wHTH) protein/Flp pilus assembly protein TadD
MTSPKKLRKVKFGDYVADFESFELRKHGFRLKLQDQPFQILKLLLQSPGELVTREQLRMELWTESTFVDFDAGLNAAIRRLRDTLSDSAEEPRYVETLPRHGYRFIGEVQDVPEPLAASTEAGAAVGPMQGAEENSIDSQKQDSTAKVRRNWRIYAPAAGMVAVFLFVVALKSESFRRHLFVSHASTKSQSIAVLPFENLSRDPSEQYFADAMTDALITNLSQVNSLQVTSRTSVGRYKDSRPSLPQIAQALHVDSVIEGTVVRDGNRVRITAQLIDAASDRHLWAKRYDRDLTDILAIQADVATQIVSEVQGNLTANERDRLSQTRTVNPGAYEAFLKAKYFFQKEDDNGLVKSKEYYLKSINLDPSFAPAYVGLGENYAYEAFMRDPKPAEWLEAEKMLLKALEVDPHSASAHTLLGMIRWQYYCDSVGAEKEFDTAIQLNPGDELTRDYYSFYLLENGRRDEAILQKQQVVARDPVSIRPNAELGLYYVEAGRFDEAIQQLQQTLELDPNYFPALMRLGWAYQGKKQYEQAIVQMKKAIALDDIPRKYEYLGVVYALAGKKQEALETIELLKKRQDEDNATAAGIALIYLDLGQKELSLSWLEKAKPQDAISLSDPGFDGLRSDPRFKSIEARMKVEAKEACPPK